MSVCEIVMGVYSILEINQHHKGLTTTNKPLRICLKRWNKCYKFEILSATFITILVSVCVARYLCLIFFPKIQKYLAICTGSGMKINVALYLFYLAIIQENVTKIL